MNEFTIQEIRAVYQEKKVETYGDLKKFTSSFQVAHWLEKEISPENYEKFKKTTARLNELELYEAYKNSLLLVMELRNLVEKQYQLTISDDFLGKLFNYMNE